MRADNGVCGGEKDADDDNTNGAIGSQRVGHARALRRLWLDLRVSDVS